MNGSGAWQVMITAPIRRSALLSESRPGRLLRYGTITDNVRDQFSGSVFAMIFSASCRIISLHLFNNLLDKFNWRSVVCQ